MKQELYEQFIQAKNRGLKSEARDALLKFMASFESFEEKRAWTEHFLEHEDFGHKIRHELYEQIVFPVLLDGYKKRDSWSILWLARTAQSFYANEKLFAAISYKTELILLSESYAIEPTEEVRQELLKKQIRWFDYSQHEWPAGILWGNNGATSKECDDIFDVLADTRQLDTEKIYASYLDDYENKLKQYAGKSKNRQQNRRVLVLRLKRMNILVTQHAATENLGLWDEFFAEIGARVHYIRAYDGEKVPTSLIEYSKLRDTTFDALISLGGAMNVDEESAHSWLREENLLIQNCLQNQIPFFGFCLGAQLLAKAAGAKVVKSPQSEIGWMNVELNQTGRNSAIFQGLPTTFETLQWHGDMFEIPSNGTNLAFSDACPNQALQIGKRAFGLQFHLEVSPDELELWMQNDDWTPTIEGAQTHQEMRRRAQENAVEMCALSRRVFDNFCGLIAS